jgi:hypothetical protein
MFTRIENSPERLMVTKSEEYRENARNCGELAAEAKDLPSRNRFKRMQDAWLALAEEQDWLDGELPPQK